MFDDKEMSSLICGIVTVFINSSHLLKIETNYSVNYNVGDSNLTVDELSQCLLIWYYISSLNIWAYESISWKEFQEGWKIS